MGVPVDEIRAHRAAQKIIEQLHCISGYRSYMKRYRYESNTYQLDFSFIYFFTNLSQLINRTLFQRRNSAMPLECLSFFQQLVDDIFDISLGDKNPDLEHKSGSLKDFIKTGFR